MIVLRNEIIWIMKFVHGWKSIGLLFGNYSINFATDCAYLLKSTKSFSIDCLLRIQCRNYFEISEMESDCDLCVMISAQNAEMHLFKYTMNDNRWAFLLPRNTCSFFFLKLWEKVFHVHYSCSSSIFHSFIVKKKRLPSLFLDTIQWTLNSG